MSTHASTHETQGDRLLFPGDARLRDAVLAWIEALARERRMSSNTVEAYGRDLRQFLHHLASRQGTPTIPMLIGLKVRDIRGFMAARRADEVSGRSLMRMLAGLRSFARFLEREGFGTVSALGGVRSPKVPRRLPRPLPVSAAVALTDTAIRAGEEREPWVLARDAAVLALLYGAGLRISEALGLSRRDAPCRASIRSPCSARAASSAWSRSCPSWRRPWPTTSPPAPAAAAGGTAVPRCPGRPALAAHHPVHRRARPRRPGLARERHAARPAAFLRNPSAGAPGRAARDPGTPGPRFPVHDAALHAGRRRPSHERLRGGPPEGRPLTKIAKNLNFERAHRRL